ncbi:hypothetical protein HY407_04045 [Candidatus Gottesmanbacteria bacterium]|nr:hypothetical protein [Candidatus Gottesmanbacteria bacterium]
MKRIKLSDTQRAIFFSTLKNKIGLPWKQIANSIDISGRALTDWRSGKLTVSERQFSILSEKYNIVVPGEIRILSKYWYIPIAAKKGGLEYVKKYGPPGDLESRRKGGINSIKSHRRLKTNFITAKKIFIPKKSSTLAEFFGILLGDGGIKRNQVIISLNSQKEKKYAEFICQLIKQLFKISPSLYHSRVQNVISVAVSSVNLVEFLISHGLKIGNKVKNEIDIPPWILKKISWKRAVLRGLFDTDGSVYIDTHTINSKVYRNICLAFTNYSIPLLRTTNTLLRELGYIPTTSTRFRVNLQRENQVYKFLQEIGSHNYNNIVKYQSFFN